MADPLADLSNKGVSVRLDDLSRQRLVSGSLADLAANDHVVRGDNQSGHLRPGGHRQRRVRGSNA